MTQESNGVFGAEGKSTFAQRGDKGNRTKKKERTQSPLLCVHCQIDISRFYREMT